MPPPSALTTILYCWWRDEVNTILLVLLNAVGVRLGLGVLVGDAVRVGDGV